MIIGYIQHHPLSSAASAIEHSAADGSAGTDQLSWGGGKSDKELN